MEPVTIHVGRSADGCAYELSPASRNRLKNVAGTRLVRRVFVSYDDQAGFEADHGPIEWQVAGLLTGLDRTRLEQLGGVALYDPRSRTTTTLGDKHAA